MCGPLVTLCRSFHQEGVIHVVFSLNSGHLLGAVGNDMYHSLAVYKWQENQILFTTRTHTVNITTCIIGSWFVINVCGAFVVWLFRVIVCPAPS